MKEFLAICVVLFSLIAAASIWGSYKNKKATSLVLSICWSAKPGTPIDALKSKYPLSRNGLKLSESETEAMFYVGGAFWSTYMCRVALRNGIIVSASSSEDS